MVALEHQPKDGTASQDFLAKREAAVTFTERTTDRREEAAQRREDAAGLRESGATQRERALRPKEEAARLETELRVKTQAQKVDLNEVVNEILLLLEVSIPSQVVLTRHLAERLPFVKGDAVQIFQVLMYLITNAGEAFAGRANGAITISTGVENLDVPPGGQGVWFLPVPPGCFATLEVRDSGCGMTPEVMDKVFDPYFTTKATGHGLGMAAVLGIVRNHGGGLWGTSEPGQGTTFKFYLPVMTGLRSGAAVEGRPAWRGDGQILLVDPDFSVRRGICQLASQCGFSVIEATDGKEAVEVFRLHHDQLDWVLLAVETSLLEWETVFQDLRALDPSVPVVLGCGLEFPSGSLADGLAGLLRKPYRAAEFKGLLQRTTLPPNPSGQ